MGACNSTGYSRTFTLDELKDLAIGERREMPKGCGPNVDGMHAGSCYSRLTERGFGFPNNGEFAWGGTGSACNMCSCIIKGYGCDNCTGSSSITGRRGTVKRIAFNAKPEDCCKQQNNIINGQTCNPKYIKGYQDDSCDSYMSNYCTGNNLSTPECQKWVNAALDRGRTTPNYAMKEYCAQGQNFQNQVCQQWCDKTKNIPSMSGECDQVVQKYCQNNPNNPLCQCILPPGSITKVEALMTSPKVCWYRACQNLVNDNYITSTMRDQKKNCISTVCSIDVGDIQISGTNNQVDFKNQCATNLLKTEVKEEMEREKQKQKDIETVNRIVENKEKQSPTSDKLMIYVIILIILAIISLIVAVLLYKKSKVGGWIMIAFGFVTLVVSIYLLIKRNKDKQKTVISQ
ncbi:MAG: DUF4064 domain-containing protein [candidate division WOR-3 bacterium]